MYGSRVACSRRFILAIVIGGSKSGCWEGRSATINRVRWIEVRRFRGFKIRLKQASRQLPTCRLKQMRSSLSMQERVLQRLKLPLPTDFFPPTNVDDGVLDQWECQSRDQVLQALDHECQWNKAKAWQRARTWKSLGTHMGMEMFKSRHGERGNRGVVTVRAHGEVNGSMRAIEMGLDIQSTDEMRIYSRIMHDHAVDAAVLSTLSGKRQRENTGDSLCYKSVKWLAMDVPTKIGVSVKSDMCWYEKVGRIKDMNGNAVTFLTISPVRLDGCPRFHDAGIKRVSASMCFIFRQASPSRISIFASGSQHCRLTKLMEGDEQVWKRWRGYASIVQCAIAKELGVQHASKTPVYTRRHNSCKVCARQVLECRGRDCAVCGHHVCRTCSIKTTLFNPGIEIARISKTAVCKKCYGSASLTVRNSQYAQSIGHAIPCEDGEHPTHSASRVQDQPKNTSAAETSDSETSRLNQKPSNRSRRSVTNDCSTGHSTKVLSVQPSIPVNDEMEKPRRRSTPSGCSGQVANAKASRQSFVDIHHLPYLNSEGVDCFQADRRPVSRAELILEKLRHFNATAELTYLRAKYNHSPAFRRMFNNATTPCRLPRSRQLLNDHQSCHRKTVL